MKPPFLILETGQPVPSMRRHRGFPHWIRVAAGLGRDEAVVVNVEAGDELPGRDGFAGAIVTGSGAMVTDRYLPVDHRPEVRELVEHCSKEGLTLVGVDNVEGSVALEGAVLPERACLVFGSEASGLSEEMLAACEIVVAITQRGSTRSMNVGHAAAIVMWAHASRLEAAEK